MSGSAEECNCHDGIRDTVHDLLDQLVGFSAKSWVDKVSEVRWFLSSGGEEALLGHGWIFEAYEGGGVMCRRDEPEPATPRDIFLQAYEFTGNRDDYVTAVDVRGHWLAEHCTVPVALRGEGAEVLLSLGATRGRVKGVTGGVLRGVRKWEPMSVEAVAEAFA